MKTRQKKKQARVSIIIAAKNEGAGLKEIITSVKPYAQEIILVDGHSTDNSIDIAKQQKIKYFLDNGKGRGDALKIGIREATGDIIVFFDADGSHEATDIPRLVAEVEKGSDLVICSRRTGGSFDAPITFSGMIRSFGSDLLTCLLNNRFNTQFTDILYSFRALNAKTAKALPIRANGFAVEQEMVAICCHKGYKITEIPSREKARGWGESKLQTIGGIKLLLLLLQQLYFSEY